MFGDADSAGYIRRLGGFTMEQTTILTRPLQTKEDHGSHLVEPLNDVTEPACCTILKGSSKVFVVPPRTLNIFSPHFEASFFWIPTRTLP